MKVTVNVPFLFYFFFLGRRRHKYLTAKMNRHRNESENGVDGVFETRKTFQPAGA